MCHVLVIEDEPMIAEIICDFLRDEGATSFDVAETADDAIRMAAAHQPKVITSDIRLAKGRGPDAVNVIRARHGELPTIFITGTPDECGPCKYAVAVLAKPFSPLMLADAFSKALAAA
ncbi:response regulator [Microvirga sp. SRT01]|uniref:Response regulator n=1 Tax=Sphingomonas longa TaxID=2778730 RepID=A0ABS2D9M9_9SPHN|nr:MULTISPECIES: response regulator [Alphaproteobacteria]MBM6577630.1 response regulator [Sphingomonas sp. BT552]MBR7710675.1 response regulator [Microvirga sp. SRT01]